MMRSAGARAFQCHRGLGLQVHELDELGFSAAIALARCLADSNCNLAELRDLVVEYFRGWLDETERASGS